MKKCVACLVVTKWETANKYQIKNSLGQPVYFASEGNARGLLFAYLGSYNCCTYCKCIAFCNTVGASSDGKYRHFEAGTA